jgi:hypothetical protein
MNLFFSRIDDVLRGATISLRENCLDASANAFSLPPALTADWLRQPRAFDLSGRR